MDSSSHKKYECPECGIELRSPEPICWLCRSKKQPVAYRPSAIADNPFASPLSNNEDYDYEPFWVEPVLILGIVGIVAGAWYIDNSYGLLALAIFTPVSIRSSAVFNIRRRKGVPTTSIERAKMVIGSTFATVIIYLILCAALFGSALIAVGLSCSSGKEAPKLVGFLIAGLLTFVVVARITYLNVRRRWRRDTGDDAQ